MLIDAGSIKEDQVVTLSSGYTAEGDGYDPVAFPKVSFHIHNWRQRRQR